MPVMRSTTGYASRPPEDRPQAAVSEEEERLTGARLRLKLLADKGAVRRGLTTGEAVHVLWLLMSPDQYYRLVHGRGWSPRRYERWLAAAIRRLLLPEA